MLMRRLGFLAIAAFISIGTIIGVRSWLHAQLAARAVPATTPAPVAALNRMVLVATGDLPAGQFVRPDNLHWQAWPEASIAENYVVEGKGKLDDYVGAVVRSGLTNGEPIADGRVVRPGDRGFMAAVLTPGDRAVTVPVTPSSGLAGFVFPGDRVDVILTLTIQPETKDGQKVERRASETVLTDIRVLATDQRADDQKREVTVAKTATLEVTPKQVEVIAVSSEMGKLSLSLRSLAQGGPQVAEANTHTWDDDAARLLRSLPHAAGGGGRKVSVVRGSESKDIEFAGMAR